MSPCGDPTTCIDCGADIDLCCLSGGGFAVLSGADVRSDVAFWR